MVENISNQTIDFIGQIKEQEKREKIGIMDYPTQVAIVELNKNYNKFINNMFKTCAKVCINNFNYPKLGGSEKSCVESCQRKFFETYYIGQNFVNAVLAETNKTDLFSESEEVDIIKNANKLNK